MTKADADALLEQLIADIRECVKERRCGCNDRHKAEIGVCLLADLSGGPS